MAVDANAEPRAPAPATSPAAEEAEFLWELRKYVLLLATLAATVTYTAGLDPPGGFWTDNDVKHHHLAGDPVLQATYPRRYKAFFYCNATSFVASVVIVNLLLVRYLCRRRWWLRALQAAMILDMFGLMGAYAAGSSREVAMSAYIVVLVILVCSYVSAHVLVYGLTAAGQTSSPDAPESVERARKYLLIFATLAATVAYQAGLSTPGGFWHGTQAGSHVAGDPMLRGKHPYRFMVFFYFNTTAFVASLVTIILLMSKTVTRHGFRSSALWVCVAATMVGLVGAFAAGSCRSFKTSVYVIALVVAVLLYIFIQAMVFFSEPVKNWLHRAGQRLQSFLKLDELEQRNRQQITQFDAYIILKKSRMYLLLLGILAASVTYQAGLNPPGGFWQSDGTDGHRNYLAGDPILHITYHRRYMVFFYCNATAFIASLVILILLLSNTITTQGIKYCALQVAMILDLFGLIGAYAAGSCRQASKSVYVSVLVLPVFLYIGIHVLVFMLDVSPTWATWRGRVREKLQQCVPKWLEKLLALEAHVDDDHEEEWRLEKRRKLLLLVAILAASLTYEAGMNPPGGFWQEGKSGHVGDPVLNNGYYRRRYLAFFFCNATAFVASLAIIMLLVNRKLSTGGIRSYALRVCVILDLVGLMGAFAAGSCRKVKTSIYVFVLVFAVLLCIAFQVALVVSKSLRNLTNKLLSKLGAAIEDDAAGERLPHTAGDGDGQPRDLWDEKLPKYLLLIGALAAAVTYQAAMNPPGGLWDDGQTAHIAGDPVLLSSYPRRYKVFFYCNATSFMASLVIMVLLLIKRVSNTQPALLALHAAMILDLFGLMGAYAAGSCRRVTTSAYILALLVGVSAYIVVLVVVSIGVARWMKRVMDKVGEKLAHCFSFDDL
uniref:PGG domain-containing protein n=1 Tax=Leersia perrieri TaxID=77586 RepID=A0A0D9XNZ9_9ORYZ